MPQPTPDLSRDQQCHHYQAPTGQRCGSPALKGEYYCYHHHVRNANRSNKRVLIDPELTRLDLPVVEDRASIFVALSAVIHRLAANTIDTRRAGQMIYALQTALQALPPERPAATQPSPAPQHPPVAPLPTSQNCHPERSAQREAEGPASSAPTDPSTGTKESQQSTPPKQITLTKESLLYFLRSRHCAHCNAELFPAHELTERPNPGAPPEIIEESRPTLPAPETASRHFGTIPTLQATAELECPIHDHLIFTNGIRHRSPVSTHPAPRKRMRSRAPKKAASAGRLLYNSYLRASKGTKHPATTEKTMTNRRSHA